MMGGVVYIVLRKEKNNNNLHGMELKWQRQFDSFNESIGVN
jgi:hypothetical protein